MQEMIAMITRIRRTQPKVPMTPLPVAKECSMASPYKLLYLCLIELGSVLWLSNSDLVWLRGVKHSCWILTCWVFTIHWQKVARFSWEPGSKYTGAEVFSIVDFPG